MAALAAVAIRYNRTSFVPARPPEPTTTISIPVPELELGIVAIIIDDIGHNKMAAKPFLEMENPVALSILPGRPAALELAREGLAAGKTIMLHLPMEPVNQNTDPGAGAIRKGMRRSQVDRVLEEDLAMVPGAVGVNNHMGSLATADRRIMGEVLRQLQDRGLFFIDSRTTPRTVGYEMASERGLPTAIRDVFLDNDRDPEKIDAMVEQLLETARKRGWALGIGHPYPETAEALLRLATEAENRHIRWVPVPELLRRIDNNGS